VTAIWLRSEKPGQTPNNLKGEGNQPVRIWFMHTDKGTENTAMSAKNYYVIIVK
jgi:hypothetical protein